MKYRQSLVLFLGYPPVSFVAVIFPPRTFQHVLNPFSKKAPFVSQATVDIVIFKEYRLCAYTFFLQSVKRHFDEYHHVHLDRKSRRA